VITLVQWIIGPHVAHWPLVARTFLLTAPAVPTAVSLRRSGHQSVCGPVHASMTSTACSRCRC